MISNLSKLGTTLSSRMAKTAAAAVPLCLELATVNGDMSITTDSFPEPIKKNEYMINLQLTHKNYFTYNEMNSTKKSPHVHKGGEHDQMRGTGYHEHITNESLHDHRVPSVFRKLKAGDRVLVAWVGGEPIVIAIVVPGDTISQNDWNEND